MLFPYICDKGSYLGVRLGIHRIHELHCDLSGRMNSRFSQVGKLGSGLGYGHLFSCLILYNEGRDYGMSVPINQQIGFLDIGNKCFGGPFVPIIHFLAQMG